MLDGCKDSLLPAGLLVFPGKAEDSFRVVSIGADICNGVTPVEIYIHHWSEGVVAAHSPGLPAAYFSQPVGILCLGCSCNLHLLTE